MNPRAWLGVVIGTAVAASGFWLSLLAIGDAPVLGLSAIAVSTVVAMTAVTGFGGAEDPFRVALRSATIGLAMGSFLFVLWGVTGNGAIALLIPSAVLGTAATAGLPPIGDPERLGMRVIASGVAALLALVLGLVEPSLWSVFAPLLPLPAVAVADVMVERSAEP